MNSCCRSQLCSLVCEERKSVCLESARPDTPRGHMDWSLFCLYFNWEYLSNLKFHQIPGVQRLRCYPFRKTKNFAGRTFHGKNQQDVVALIPSDVVGSDFQYDRKLEAARIQLFFEFTLLPHSSLPQEEPSSRTSRLLLTL